MRQKLLLEVDVTVTESEDDGGRKLVHVDFSHPELTGELGFWCPSLVWAEKMVESIHSTSPEHPIMETLNSILAIKGGIKEIVTIVKGS